MTPIEFLIENREAVLNAYAGSPVEAWRKLVELVQVDKVMTENTFRTNLKPFAETCKFFNSRLNERLNIDSGINNRLNETAELNTRLNETITGLNEKLNNEQELNIRLNIQVEELNKRLNRLEELNTVLNNELAKCRLNVPDGEGLNNGLNNMESEQAKSKLNIAGWTVAKSGKYYRAFRKIKGRVYGVHLGKDLTDAETKITAKQLQIQN